MPAPKPHQPEPPPPPVTRASILRGAYGPYRANNDLLSYHLDIRVDPDKQTVAGKNTIRFRMLKDGARIQLDLRDTLNIDSDVIGGPVSGLPGARLDRGPSLLDGTDAVTVAPGKTTTASLTVGGATGEQWHVTAPSGLTVWPSSGVVFPDLGRAANVRFIVHADSSLATGRYDVPVTFSLGNKTVAETFELVSVTGQGTALPTTSPIVLYAADSTSMTSAVAIARADALPVSDVTGDYSQVWSDVNNGDDIVIAVGAAAVDGLFENACGWSNPGGLPANETPFYWLGTPFSTPPGADVYVPADGTTAANSALLAAQLTHFALAGTLPDYGRPATQLPRPTDTCLGSADIPVP